MIKNDNRGITLVELMLSMALLVIVTGCLIFLMNSASKAYSKGDVQVRLQKEAADAINYMTDSTLSSNYAKAVSSGGISGVLLYNVDTEDHSKAVQKLFASKGGSIYFYYGEDAASLQLINDVIGGTADVSEEYLLCTNIEGFEVALDEVHLEDNPSVKYTIKLEAKSPKEKFELTNTVVMRNMIVEPAAASPGGI